MKAAAALALLLPVVAARFVDPLDAGGDHVQLHPEAAAAETYLIELGPGETQWVTEEQKWELRRNGRRFLDITEHRDLGLANAARVQAAAGGPKRVFPPNVTFADKVLPLLDGLDKAPMQEHLERFTKFHTRYYKSNYGKQSAAWLLGQVKKTVGEGRGFQHGATVERFHHPWGQDSIIARIPGQTNRTIVVGAHQDSINLFLPSVLAAPGADDDGSGTVTILEVLRGLLVPDGGLFAPQHQQQQHRQRGHEGGPGKTTGPLNTIEFHWYSAEEGGMLGSQALFAAYEKEGRDVRAMLQQDMTGFVQKTLDAGDVESVGVVVDYVDPALTAFVKQVITAYCDIPYVETKCGYACSDHAAASKAGYASAFVIESAFENSDGHIHTTDDSIRYLSFDHMLQHARLTLGFVYELAFTDFDALEAAAAGAKAAEAATEGPMAEL